MRVINISARLRRLAADHERMRNDFIGHKHVRVEPIGAATPPERYVVTYYVNGYALDPSGKPVIVKEHRVEIYLHADYPRNKPRCTMLTPIFHPNFKGVVCLGDHWGAGETLSDVIVHIGDMIQYRSYNPKSPLHAEAARWSLNNQHLFPASNIDLWQPEPAISLEEKEDDFEIDLSESKKRPQAADFDIELAEPVGGK